MNYFIYIAFISHFFVYSQNNDSIPLFEYEVNYSLGKALVKKGTVFELDGNIYYNTSKTEFLENMERLTFSEQTGVPNINIISAGNGIENNVSLLKENIHIDTYSVGNEVIRTDEVLQKLQWVSTGEKRVVNGRDCVKMMSKFRGRVYLAYVDLTVPVNFGPWKFNNFPGLPVLIYDIENKLKWTLTGINKESRSDFFDFIQKQKFYLNSLRKVTLREYVKIYDETDNGRSTIVSKLPRDYKQVPGQKKKKRGGLELIFEWETED
jgi:GLPGLI family protein